MSLADPCAMHYQEALLPHFATSLSPANSTVLNIFFVHLRVPTPCPGVQYGGPLSPRPCVIQGNAGSRPSRVATRTAILTPDSSSPHAHTERDRHGRSIPPIGRVSECESGGGWGRVLVSCSMR